MFDIIIKCIIIIIFLFMDEIPYLLKLFITLAIGTTIILDWYSDEGEDSNNE